VDENFTARVHPWLARGQARGDQARNPDFYELSSARLLSFLADAADAELTLITKGQLVAYRAHLFQYLSARTVNHHLTLAHMIFKAARRDGLLIDDPSEFVGSVKQRSAQSARRRAFTVEELEAVIAVADPEWRSLILFGLYTGQRLMDIVRLTWVNIDLTRNELRLVTAKTGRLVILPLAAPLREYIESLPSSDDPGAPIHPRSAATVNGAALSTQFVTLLVQAGLRERGSITGGARSARRVQSELSFHSLRHTCVSLLHAGGVPQATAEAFAGHSSSSVHNLYVHTDRASLQRAADTLPALRRARD
jgi:integrase